MFEKDVSREDQVMAARTMAPEVKAARIAELEAELDLLKLPPYVEYPKALPDGRVVESAEAEAAATEPSAKTEAAEPEPEPELEPEPEPTAKATKAKR